MKNIFTTITVALAFGATAVAGQCACNKPVAASCSPCQTVQWYKAKDGTFREKMPYSKALDRAEDADDMEPVLKKTQADLAASTAQTEAANSELTQIKAEKAAMEAQLAELKKQLDTEKQNTASQTERAIKAEAAHKLCVEQVAQLRDEAKRNDEAAATVKGELKTTSEERDALKTAKSDLEKQVTDLNSAKTAAEEANKSAQQELEKLKQEAAESKKAKIEEEEAARKAAEKPPEEPAPTEPPAAPAPTDPPAGEKLVAE